MTPPKNYEEVSQVTSFVGKLDGKLEYLTEAMDTCSEKIDELAGSVREINQRCLDREKFCSYKFEQLSTNGCSAKKEISDLQQASHSIKISWQTVQMVGIILAGIVTATVGIMALITHFK